MTMSNFVNWALLLKKENNCFFKKTFAAFDLRVVDADILLSLFIIVYLNGDPALTLTYFTERSNFVS